MCRKSVVTIVIMERNRCSLDECLTFGNPAASSYGRVVRLISATNSSLRVVRHHYRHHFALSRYQLRASPLLCLDHSITAYIRGGSSGFAPIGGRGHLGWSGMVLGRGAARRIRKGPASAGPGLLFFRHGNLSSATAGLLMPPRPACSGRSCRRASSGLGAVLLRWALLRRPSSATCRSGR